MFTKKKKNYWALLKLYLFFHIIIGFTFKFMNGSQLYVKLEDNTVPSSYLGEGRPNFKLIRKLRQYSSSYYEISRL
jgi:hypothetical protein